MTERWNPILDKKAGTYCSPGCGMGCTLAQHNAAQQAATDLSVRMGPGWTTRVWENLGWHYAVHSPCDRIRLHPPVRRRIGSYTAFLGERGGLGGKWVANAGTPEKAVAAVVAKAKEELSQLGAVLEGL